MFGKLNLVKILIRDSGRGTQLLNFLPLACGKVEVKDLAFCIVINGEKNRRANSDLSLDQTTTNVELQATFIYYYMCTFKGPCVNIRGLE